MNSKINSFIFLFLLTFLFSTTLRAEIIFQDNFDDHSDWSPAQLEHDQGDSTASTDGDDKIRCTDCPDGSAIYAGYRVASSAWNDYVGDTMEISPTNARGGTGKALTLYYEPIDSVLCDNGTYWCSDQMLVVKLPRTYNEVYVRYFVKFQPGWVWNTTTGMQMKMVHISQYIGGTMFKFFKSGNHWPLVIPIIQQSPGSGSMIGFSPRKQSCYYPNEGVDQLGYSDYTRTSVPSWNSYLADGGWHHLEWHFKGNSSKGTSDGVMQVFIDGESVYNVANVIFADRGKDASGNVCCDDVDASKAVNPPSDFVGWNMVMIGGNAINRYYSSDKHNEQWYAIDDLVISTNYIGLGEPVDEVEEEGEEPSVPGSPSNLRVN